MDKQPLFCSILWMYFYSVIDVDVFTKRLFDIYLEVLNEGPAQVYIIFITNES